MCLVKLVKLGNEVSVSSHVVKAPRCMLGYDLNYDVVPAAMNGALNVSEPGENVGVENITIRGWK